MQRVGGTQLLFTIDDKYISSEHSAEFLAKDFKAIPELYLKKLLPLFPSEEELRYHLSSFLNNFYDHQHSRDYNKYLLSEKYMVRRFKARRESKTSYMEYNSFYH
ncbi:MAG: hypothetical protein LBI53_07500 [Candidatus Peribacteria bacterium]|nr:hypothetical protein [Candidatus Peribacteria bacterium]